MSKATTLSQWLDALYEFEREPVTKNKLQGIGNLLGISDLTILRCAKKWTYGFASAAGMFLRHQVAWIASGILYAASHSANLVS